MNQSQKRVNYFLTTVLVEIGDQNILKKLFQSIVIPRAVFDELRHDQAPKIVRDFISSPPEWIEIQEITQTIGASLHILDAGEQQVMTLAQEIHADLILLDEAKGRRTAVEEKFKIIGTLGILELADIRGLVNLSEALMKLNNTTFRIASYLVQEAIERHTHRSNG